MTKKMIRNLIIAGGSLLLVVGVILLIVFLPKTENASAESPEVFTMDPGTPLEVFVNEDGLNCAEVVTDENGELSHNSYGTLIQKPPAEISKIEVKSQSGSYTLLLYTPVSEDGKTSDTIFTLEGYEDFPLAPTQPSLVAGAACYVNFTKVADINGENAADYGFSSPRAEATVYYLDGTRSVVRMGDNAPGSEYCYIQFGESDTVYSAAYADMEALLSDVNDLISTAINDDLKTISDDSYDVITLGGTHLKEEVTITANTDECIDSIYVMTSQDMRPVNAVTGSKIEGSIKALAADSVLCLNPTASDLETYSLKTPYATVSTTYYFVSTKYDANGNKVSEEETERKITLLASEQDSEGFVNLMEKGGKIIYRIAAKSVPWATVTMEDLSSEYVFTPKYSMLDSVVVKAGDKSYTFTMGTKEVTTTDAAGNATTAMEIIASYDGKELMEGQFYSFFQDITSLELEGSYSNEKAGDLMLSVTYRYKNGRTQDTVEFYESSDQKALPKVGGEFVGYVYKSDIEAIVKNAELLAQGKEIDTIR